MTEKTERGPRRHPNEVTSDRLADFLDRYADRLDGGDRDAVARVRQLLLAHTEGGA